MMLKFLSSINIFGTIYDYFNLAVLLHGWNNNDTINRCMYNDEHQVANVPVNHNNSCRWKLTYMDNS